MVVQIRAAVIERGMGEQPFAGAAIRLGNKWGEAGVFAGKAGSRLLKKAVILEFGSQDVGAQAFFRKAVDANLEKYANLMQAAESRIIDRGASIGLAIGNVGRALVADIRKQIRATGQDTTGELAASVSFRIQDGNPR